MQKPDKLPNKKCQSLFNLETEEILDFVECFENQLPFEKQYRKWLKTFNSSLYKCFRKVRIVDNGKKNVEKDKLFQERVALKKEQKIISITEEMRRKIEERISQIQEDISDQISQKYVDEIFTAPKQLGGDNQNLSGSGRKTFWELLKNKYPKCAKSVPVVRKKKVRKDSD